MLCVGVTNSITQSENYWFKASLALKNAASKETFHIDSIDMTYDMFWKFSS